MSRLVRAFMIAVCLVMPSPHVLAANQSGVVAALKGTVTIIRGGEKITAAPSLPIYFNDRVQTGSGAKIQILLRDQSTFSVGPDAEIVIDDFVYDPKKKTGRVAASISKGAFRFVSGKIAKKDPDNMRVKAGNVVVAVRGTEVIGDVSETASQVVLLSGAIDLMSVSPECVDMQSGGGSVFEKDADGRLRMSVSPKVNAPATCVGAIAKPGFVVTVSSAGEVSKPLRVDPDEVDQILTELKITADDGEEATDAEATDAEATDAEATDAEATDAEATDAEATDAEATDAEATDAEATDAEATDAEATDAEGAAVGSTDAEATDADIEGADPKSTDAVTSAASSTSDQDDDKAEIASSETDKSQATDSADTTSSTLSGTTERDASVDTDSSALESVNVGEDGKPVVSSTSATTTSSRDLMTTQEDAVKIEDTVKQESFDELFVNDLLKPTVDQADKDLTADAMDSLKLDEKIEPVLADEKVDDGKTVVEVAADEKEDDSGKVELSDVQEKVTEDKTESSVATTQSSQTTNTAPTLTLPAGYSSFSFTDSAADDSATLLATASGIKAVGSDSDAGDTLTYSIVDGSTLSNSVAGTYGTLSIQASTGEYVFTPDVNAIEGLKSSASETYTIRVKDAAGLSADQTLTINLTGADDTLSITTTPAGSGSVTQYYDGQVVALDRDDTITLTTTYLPLGLSLVDNGDGTGTVTGVPWIAGTASRPTVFSANSSTSNATFTIADNIVDSTYKKSTDPLSYLTNVYNSSQNTHTLGGVKYNEYATWNALTADTLASGSELDAAGFSKYGSTLTFSDGSTGTLNLQVYLNHQQKTVTTNVWGSFDGYKGETGYFSGTSTSPWESFDFSDNCQGVDSVSGGATAKCTVSLEDLDLKVCSSTTNEWCAANDTANYPEASALSFQTNVRLLGVDPAESGEPSFALVAKVDVKDASSTSVATTYGAPGSAKDFFQLQVVDLSDASVKAPAVTSALTAASANADEKSYQATITLDAGSGKTITASTIPTWATLVDNGDGTATLSGEAKTGTYSIGVAVSDGSTTSNENIILVVTCASYNCSKFAGSRDTETSPVFSENSSNYTLAGYNPTVDGVKMQYLVYDTTPGSSWTDYFHSNAGSGVFQRSWSPSLSQGTLTFNEKLVIDFASATGENFLSGSYSGVDKAGLGLNDDSGSFVLDGSTSPGSDSLFIDFSGATGDFTKHSSTTGLYHHATYGGVTTNAYGDKIYITKHIRLLQPDVPGTGDAAIATSVKIESGSIGGQSWGTNQAVVLEPK